MAIISFGPLVDGVRGSIGGVTFSRGQSGDTARHKPRPMRPRRVEQLLNQKRLSQASHLWASQSAAQKTGWINYAATVDLTDGLGNVYHPTGLQAFIWCVTQRLNCGLSITPMAYPTQNGLPVLPVLTFTYSAHNLNLTAVSPALLGTEAILFLIHRIYLRNNFVRTLINRQNVYVLVAGLPMTLVTDYDEEWAVGLLARAFIKWRFIDQYNRTSVLQLTKFDFTVA